MNIDKEGSKFEKKNVCVCVWRGGREGAGGGGRGEGSTLTPKLYAKLCQLRSNTEIQLYTQCRAYSKNQHFEI